MQCKTFKASIYKLIKNVCILYLKGKLIQKSTVHTQSGQNITMLLEIKKTQSNHVCTACN